MKIILALLTIVIVLTFVCYPNKRPKGGLQLGTAFKDVSTCTKGKIVYRMIDVVTSWDKGTQRIEYSWQCYVSHQDNVRIRKIIGTYDYAKETTGQ